MASAGLGGAPAGFASSSFAWCQMAAVTVWKKMKESFTYLTRKEYENEGTAEQKEANRNLRIKGFLSFSSLGFGAMCWGGATQVLEHMKTKHPQQASYYIMYLTFSFLCQLIGLIAATFPLPSPWTLFFAGLGAWQSAIFGLALFHLNVMEYYEEQKYAEYSMIATCLVVSFYWSLAPQDPVFLHFLGKLLIGTVYILCIIVCWMVFIIAKAVAFTVCSPVYLLRYCRGLGKERLLPHRRRD
ncbi:unnamed protein product [Urochloa humidicola]